MKPTQLVRCGVAFLMLGLCPIVAGAGEGAAADPSPQTVLDLPSEARYPRRGAGDFIVLDDGRIRYLYTRFTALGEGDQSPAHIASRVSTDGGQTWSAEGKTVFENDAGMNLMCVSLLRLQDGRIALFYLRKNSLSDCRPVVRFSSDECQSWSEEHTIIPEEHMGYYVINCDQAVQLSSGRLIVPVSRHSGPEWKRWDLHGHQLCYLSDDGGATTWRRGETMLTGEQADGKRVMLQEPGVVELKDGRLMMWCRTDQARQYESFAEDGGITWSKMRPSTIVSPRSPASLERIPSTGDLLLVWTHLDTKAKLPRTPLHVAISKDEGKTWINEKVLEDGPGPYGYTAIDFVDDQVLLAYYTGGGAMRITRVPVDWFHGR